MGLGQILRSSSLHRLWDLKKLRFPFIYFFLFGRNNMWKVWRNIDIIIQTVGLRKIPSRSNRYICENMKKYPLRYRLWDLEKLSLPRFWDSEERNTERSEMRVVYRSFLPVEKLWDFQKFRAFPLYMCCRTGKNSEPASSKRGASRQDMKHDLHFLVWTVNTFTYKMDTQGLRLDQIIP